MEVVTTVREFPERDLVKTEVLARNSAARLVTGDAAFISVPWAGILNGVVSELSEEEVGRIRLSVASFEKVVTVCQHVEVTRLFEQMYDCGINCLLTPHCTTELRSMGRFINISAIPHAPHLRKFPKLERTLFYSFQGVPNHPVRMSLRRLESAKTPIVLLERWQLDHGVLPENQASFQELLSRSIFSLCPRGAGPGSLRISESLLAGSIPVILSKDFVLPHGWERACIVVDERSWESVPKMLEGIGSDEIRLLQREGENIAETCLDTARFAECCLVESLKFDD